ncbi:hypothetical protein NOR_07928 [Metarhizium rileyi]|uniref:Uncharacterized protein n=1 Tax=Metarhizium rileyi (strain RCEF 4871) TaxID=1649241 RepID=A0A166X8P1_METRR|nr:hypothetical protein NOR_07928 [Metarhizium rileyi RCEF 4871]
MASEQSPETGAHTVSSIQAPASSPITQPREPPHLVQPPQLASTTGPNAAVQQPQAHGHNLNPQSYGAHYVPYDQTAPQQFHQMHQQQGQQPVTYMTVPPFLQQPPQSNRRRITKDILHVIVLVVSIIGMGFSFSLLGRAVNRSYRSRTGYYYYDDDYDNYLPAVTVGPIFAVAFLWSLVELIVRCARKWKAGIHPGAHVGVCLCIWLAALGVGALLAIFVTQPWYYELCSRSSRSSRRSCSRYQNSMFVGSTVLALLLAIFEFAIFAIACADTHVRNRWKRSVVVASTPYWAPPPQGWYVAPGQQQQQQSAPMTQAQPTAANTRDAETQPTAAGIRGNEKGPVPPEQTLKEFYTPGTAQ